MNVLIKKIKSHCEFKTINGYVQVPLSLWIVVGICSLVLLCLHIHNDIVITAKQSLNFWDLLFEGRPLDFYLDARMVSGNEYFPVKQGAAYLFPLYLIFAIWNFPIWILSRTVGVELFNTIPSMIWMKLMLIPFVLLSARCIFRIVNMTENKKEYAVLASFFFISSLLILLPTVLIGQYDIISTLLMLLGFEAWLSENRRKFIVYFAMAIWFKYFALLYFLPLLFLGEKKIRRILISLFEVIIPAIPFLFIFPKPEGQGSNVYKLIGFFLEGVQLTDRIKIYLFPIVFALVLVACLFTRTNAENRFRYAVYYLFIIMGSFCVLINPYTYWLVLASPIFILIVFVSNNMNKTVILEMILGVGIAIKNYLIYHWFFGTKTTGGMGVLHRLLGKKAPDPNISISLLYPLSNSSKALSVAFNSLIIVFAVMIFFSRPNAKKESMFEPFNAGTVYARTAFNVIVALLPTLFLVIYTIFRG